jgi:hypothetical protein
VADLEELRARLEGIADELADAAMDALRQALEDGAVRRPEAERRITQARRAVERAAAALGAITEPGSGARRGAASTGP